MHLTSQRSYAVVVLAAALTSGCAAGSRSVAADVPQPSLAPTSVASISPSTTGSIPSAASASSATLDYVSPAGNSGSPVHKTVVGATYQRLAADLAALKPVPPGNAMCNVLTIETATITVTSAGHTKVFLVDGSPCRGVQLTTDGVAQPLLAGSITLLTQVRAIAGTSGLAHPLGAG